MGNTHVKKQVVDVKDYEDFVVFKSNKNNEEVKIWQFDASIEEQITKYNKDKNELSPKEKSLFFEVLKKFFLSEE